MPTIQEMDDSNKTLLYEALTPFRRLRATLIIILLLIVITAITLFEQTTWLVGLGTMGWMSRAKTAEILNGDREALSQQLTPRDAATYTVDFSHRQHGWQYRYGQGARVSRIALDPLPPIPGHAYPPDYCYEYTVQSDPGQHMEGWYNRTRTVYERKSSRMFEAYVSAAISVSYLRTTLTRIKLGMAEDEPIGKSLIAHTDCDMDPFDEDSLTPDAYARWSQASAAITMPGAPVIRMRMIDFKGFKDDVGSNEVNGGAITGMCLVDECQFVDLKYYVTKYADLFSTPVPLSAHQEHAVQALNGLSDLRYWLMVAHENGILLQDDRIREAYAAAMNQVAKSINPTRAPGSRSPIDFMGLEE